MRTIDGLYMPRIKIGAGRGMMAPGTFLLLALATFLAVELAGRTWFPPGRLSQIAESLLLYTALPLAVIQVAGRSPLAGFRINGLTLKYTLGVLALVLPFYVFGALFVPSIRAYYPLWPVTADLSGIAIHAATALALMLGTEVFFRGLLLLALRDVGPVIVLLHVIPYTVLHVGKPPIEVLSSFFAALVWGWADYRCESLVPSLVAHVTGMLVMDLLIVFTPGLS